MVLLLALLLQDPDALLRQLREGDPAERDKAEADLIGLGEAGVPALERLAKDSDPELRERIRHILAEVAVLEQRRSVLPNRTRITRRLDRVPLEEALPALLHPFGLSLHPPMIFDALRDPPDYPPLTLDLQGTGFWDLVQVLETKASIDLDFTRGGVKFRPRTQSSRAFHYFQQGELRLRLETSNPAKTLEGPLRMEFDFTAMLPPGTLPISWGVEQLRLRDDAGREIEVKPHPSFPDPVPPSRAFGELTQGSLGESVAVVDPKRTYRLSGLFTSTYPSRIIRHPIQVRTPGGTRPILLQGVRCSVTLVSGVATAKEIQESYEVLEDGPPRRFLLWSEDQRGTWLEDRSRTLLDGPKGRSSQRTGHLDLAASMDHLVLGELIGEQRVSIPFVFENVSVPPK